MSLMLTFTEGPRAAAYVAGGEPPIIAVVDDDESLRRSIRNFLRSVGFRVEVFDSAEAFLTSARHQSTACLVLDLRMSGMSGLDLLRHLEATKVHVPTIILTAHADEEIRQQCLRAGALAVLIKPVHSEALLDAVYRALR
jgi:FixJ family two-component response regulator